MRNRSGEVIYAYVGKANRSWLRSAIAKKKYESYSSFVNSAIERARGK